MNIKFKNLKIRNNLIYSIRLVKIKNLLKCNKSYLIKII